MSDLWQRSQEPELKLNSQGPELQLKSKEQEPEPQHKSQEQETELQLESRGSELQQENRGSELQQESRTSTWTSSRLGRREECAWTSSQLSGREESVWTSSQLGGSRCSSITEVFHRSSSSGKGRVYCSSSKWGHGYFFPSELPTSSSSKQELGCSSGGYTNYFITVVLPTVLLILGTKMLILAFTFVLLSCCYFRFKLFLYLQVTILLSLAFTI